MRSINPRFTYLLTYLLHTYTDVGPLLLCLGRATVTSTSQADKVCEKNYSDQVHIWKKPDWQRDGYQSPITPNKQSFNFRRWKKKSY